MIVIANIAAGIAQKKPMDVLMDPMAMTVPLGREPIFGPGDSCKKVGFYARFLANFPDRRLFGGLAVIDYSFRQLPPLLAAREDQSNFNASIRSSERDPARRDLLDCLWPFELALHLFTVNGPLDRFVQFERYLLVEPSYLLDQLALTVKDRRLRDSRVLAEDEAGQRILRISKRVVDL